jgi:hypothetical protein
MTTTTEASTAKAARLRAKIARVERQGIDRALDALGKAAATDEDPPLPPEVQEAARVVALAELAASHGHAMALQMDLIRLGVA